MAIALEVILLLKKFGHIFNKIEHHTLVVALTVMVVVIFTNVVMRYVFNNSLSWSEELARYLFIWFSWMGVSAGLKDGEHLRVEILATTLKKHGLYKANELVTIFVAAVWLATTAIVTYYGFIVVESQMSLHVVTPAMRIPVWFGYLSVPACSAVIGIRLLINIAESVGKLLGKSELESEVTQ